MADRYPLVVDSSNYRIEEIPSGDNLNLQGSSIVNVGVITATDVVITDQLVVTAGGHKVAIGTNQSSALSADNTVMDVFGGSFFDGSVGIGTTNSFAGIGTTTGVGFGTVRLAVAGDIRFVTPGITTEAFYGTSAGNVGINTSYGQYPGMNNSGISPESQILTRGVQSQVTLSVLDINGWNRQQYFGSSQYRIPDSFRNLTLKNDPQPRIPSSGGVFGNNQFYNGTGMGFHIVPNFGGSDYWAYYGYVVEPSRDRLVWGGNTAPAYSGIPAGISREAMTLVVSTGNLGIGTTAPISRLHVQGDATVTGALSKGSGSFNIPHPVVSGKRLVHSFIEGPKADLIYRGTATLTAGSASIDMDEEVGLTEGTWEALCRDAQVWVTSEDGWTLCKGSVSGSTLTITAQDPACVETVSWLVVAERQDSHMYGTEWTDENGRPILEPDEVDGSDALQTAPTLDLDALEASLKDA